MFCYLSRFLRDWGFLDLTFTRKTTEQQKQLSVNIREDVYRSNKKSILNGIN